jgi:pimeloyl-ACP methyl ester carboxylesterase
MADYADHFYKSADSRLTLYARDYGGAGREKTPLLLMHGLTRNSADFEPLAAYLSGEYRLIVADQRGRGLSDFDGDPANYNPIVYAADMGALLDSLDITKALAIGTSMGGLMAILMTQMMPGRLTAIILNDVGPEVEMAGIRRIQSYVGGGSPATDWDSAADMAEAVNAVAFPDYGPDDWMAFARRTYRENADGVPCLAYDKAIAAGMNDSDLTAVPPDLWPAWDAMGGIPVLAIRGVHSDLLSDTILAEMAARHTGDFTAVTVPNRGHAPMLDEAEALAAILSFVKKHA